MTPEAACQIVMELLAPRAGERVLDLGCGCGRLTSVLLGAGCKVTGLDRDPALIEQARLAAPEAELVCADATQYEPDEGFDAIAAIGVLHWIEPLTEAARVMVRLLHPGGRVAGVCGGDGAPEVQEAELRSALRQAGFAEVEVEESNRRLWFYAVRRGEDNVA